MGLTNGLKKVGGALGLSAVLSLSLGCATPKTSITFNSTPTNAQIYNGSVYFGNTPKTFYRSESDLARSDGNFGLWTARWNDGFELDVNVRLQGTKPLYGREHFRGQHNVLFHRPYTPPLQVQLPAGTRDSKYSTLPSN